MANRKHILVITIDGASESSKSDEDKLEKIVTDICRRMAYTKRVIFDVVRVPSYRRKKNLGEVYKIVWNAVMHYDGILIVGKSQGAIRALQFCWRYTGLLKSYPRCALVTIDPHQWSWLFDKNKTVRGVDSAIRHFNVFQREEWPRGADTMSGSSFRLSKVDHWTIVRCRLTANLINRAIRYLLNSTGDPDAD